MTPQNVLTKIATKPNIHQDLPNLPLVNVSICHEPHVSVAKHIEVSRDWNTAEDSPDFGPRCGTSAATPEAQVENHTVCWWINTHRHDFCYPWNYPIKHVVLKNLTLEFKTSFFRKNVESAVTRSCKFHHRINPRHQKVIVCRDASSKPQSASKPW